MSSDSEDEDFVTYGTPLEPLEEDAIPKKRAVTVEDQVAKDKYGRRRFHGAFTGGFSAGFFNSVGSLEGWKPSQFKSSRQVKAQSQVQKAEDYMDDEDMDEFGIAPKMLRPTGDYDRSNEGPSRKRTLPQFSDGPIPGIPVLKTLEPVRETIGIKLLMKMGWKPGHGVGPRLSKKDKSSAKTFHVVKTYGCSLPFQDDKPIQDVVQTSDESEDEEFYRNVTFAPDDFEPFLVKPKTDCFGLGYSGLDRRPVLSSHINLFEPLRPSLVMQEKTKKVSIRGQGFGVGALEKEDEDVYSTEDMSQYDFSLDTPQMIAEKRKKERHARSALPTLSTDVLEGFMLSLTPVVRKTYPPPTLPAGFTPLHRSRQSRFSASTVTDTGRVTGLTANERAVMVNEPTSSKQQTQVQENSKPVIVERTTSGTFKPFVSDPDKQERYEKYLTLSKLGQTDKLKSLQPLQMTEWEQERERAEFAQAERLYRPLSAAFSERFVSASQTDSATDPLAPVARTESADQDLCSAAKLKMFGKLTRRVGEWQPHSVLCKRFNIPQPGCVSSSQSKSSRPKFSVFNFLDAAPFNTPSEVIDVNTPCERTKTTVAETESAVTPTANTIGQEEVVVQNKTDNLNNFNDKLDQLVDSTNKMDLYRAIFLSSSDEEEEEDDKNHPGSSNQTKRPEKPTAKEQNVLRNTSPPRGIFANLDLDKLNSPRNDQLQKPQDGSSDKINFTETSPPRGIFANLSMDMTNNLLRKNNSNEIKTTDEAMKDHSASLVETKELVQDNSDMYGPTLPKVMTQPQQRVENIKAESSASENDWVEMNSVSGSETSHKKHSKKSHRKSKKHKEKKQKHKKKRK